MADDEPQDIDMADASTLLNSSVDEEDLDQKYPNRPRNHSKTLPFRALFQDLFNKLEENKPKVQRARSKLGRHGPFNLKPHEVRQSIIERFISRWRQEVGDDIYPAFRLILPDRDKDRAMYGLKEKAIARLLVKVMKISKTSEDAQSLLNWKVPGNTLASRIAGDFPGRCYEVIKKRPSLVHPGNMTIAEVNDLLDRLSAAQKEETQLPILEDLYSKMNADEMLWLIRIILRQMKVGATERTFFSIWHPDAETLYSNSSSLRKVCWELYNPNVRLEGEEVGVALMQCFQPQLAQFQMHSLDELVKKLMPPWEEDKRFWIEEKLDGERMQLHMMEDDSIPGGKRFSFWSRKAKDYTYLYGNGFHDDNSALTRHLKNAFNEGVRSIILDGEMITWDPQENAMVPFGTLKTAAIAGQRNPYSSTNQRPLFRLFDCLYLNGKQLTGYELRDRRKALEASINPLLGRFEIHPYVEAESVDKIEPELRKVVATASEGLVLKNPRSAYKLNERNDDWIKVKPEYMNEYGENLDCVVVGGYYGGGHRGGMLASFLCGLRVDENEVSRGANPMKCYSFFKVGGGFNAADYAAVRQRTEGKWKPWNRQRPPSEFVELAGGQLQYEQPDVWIRPDESVVLEVKASSVHATDQFRVGLTLRFPRFTRLRDDKDWKSALTVSGFKALQSDADKGRREREFEVDDMRKKRKVRATKKKKKELTVAGADDVVKAPYAGDSTNVFEGLSFYIVSESLSPERKTKAELEQMVKANGGKFYQTYDAVPNTICISDRANVQTAGLRKNGKYNVVRPSWLFDCIAQCQEDRARGRDRIIIPFEPKHMFATTVDTEPWVGKNADKHGDSYARDVGMDELRRILDSMPVPKTPFPHSSFRSELSARKRSTPNLRSWLFDGLTFYFASAQTTSSSRSDRERDQTQDQARDLDQDLDQNLDHDLTPRSDLPLYLARSTATFGGASVARQLSPDAKITHVVLSGERGSAARGERAREIRAEIAGWVRMASGGEGEGGDVDGDGASGLPHVVGTEWIEACWEARSWVDEG